MSTGEPLTQRDLDIARADLSGVRDAYESYKADEKARWRKQTKELQKQKEDLTQAVDRLEHTVAALAAADERNIRTISALTSAVEALSSKYTC